MTDRPVPLPESRYGRQRMSPATRRRVAFALGVLALALGIIVATIGYQRFEGNDVEGKIAAYQVVDDQTVSVTISVTRKNPSRPVYCIVRARSRDGAETGRREMLVPPVGSDDGAGHYHCQVLQATVRRRHLWLRHRRAAPIW